MEIEKIAPILIALIAAVPGVLAFLSQRRKDDTEMSKAVHDAAMSLVTPLREEVDRLRKQIQETEQAMDEALKQKDARIAELQIAVEDRDKRIDELEERVARQQEEIDSLRRNTRKRSSG